MRQVNRPRPGKSTVLMTVLVILCTSAAAAGTETVIRAGVTREITDYDAGQTSTVSRGGASFSLDDLYRFNFTCMQNRDTGDVTGTWYVLAAPENKIFSLVLGNYSLHFGSGLLMGKKTFMRPDPFSRKLSFTRDSVFSGSGSGNPAYSFFGVTSSFYTGCDDLYFQIIPFYSRQRRFISEEQVYSGAVSSSLMTVNTKTVEQGLYNSPADIVNRGIIGDAGFLGLFHFQVYGFSTILVSAGRDRLLWEKTSVSTGTDEIISLGAFAEYGDENISIFVEPAGSIRRGPGWQSYGGCVAWGVSLRNKIFSSVFNGKFSDRQFRSVYSSGDSGPEDVLDFTFSFKTGKHIKTGAAFYSEKDLTVSTGSDERKCFIREEALASITGFSMFNADFKFGRKLPLNGDSGDSVQQFSSVLNFTFSRQFYLRGRCTYQFCNAGRSWLCGSELKMMFLSYFCVSAGYTFIRAVQDNPLYGVITPASENNMDIARFTSRAGGFSLKLKYSKMKDSFYFRICGCRDSEGTEYTAESALVLFF